MSTLDIARERLAAVLEQHSAGSVTVVSSGETATGFRGVSDSDSALTDYGQQGFTSNTVRVDASDLTTPAKGSTITVDGSDVFVTNTRLDPLGATLLITYDTQRPVD